MRAILCSLALLALQLVGPGTASAQIPMPTSCVIVCDADSQHPGSSVCPHDCNSNDTAELRQCVECSCYDRCGGESGSAPAPSSGGVDSSGASSNQKGDAIDALANLFALVLMPGVFLDFKSDPATISAEVARAEADWQNHRKHRQELAQIGRDFQKKQREQRERAAQLDRDLRKAAGSKRQPVVPEALQKTSAAPSKKQRDAKRWAAHGYCRDVLEAQDKLLRNALEQAEKAARDQGAPILPTPEGGLNDAKRAAGAAGRAMLERQSKKLAGLVAKVDEFAALMKDFLACTKPGADLIAANKCLNAVLDTMKAGPLKSVLQRVLGKRTLAAITRVRDFARFHLSYVTNLRIQIQKLAIAAARCR